MTAKAAIPQRDIDRLLASFVKNGIPVRRAIYDGETRKFTVEAGQPEDGPPTGYEKIDWSE